MSATTRKCKNCGEWYDARAAACYICDQEDNDENYALKKANETAELNKHLALQTDSIRGEAAAEQAFRTARNSGVAYDRPVPVNGYNKLVREIRDALENSGF